MNVLQATITTQLVRIVTVVSKVASASHVTSRVPNAIADLISLDSNVPREFQSGLSVLSFLVK